MAAPSWGTASLPDICHPNPAGYHCTMQAGDVVAMVMEFRASPALVIQDTPDAGQQLFVWNGNETSNDEGGTG